MLMERSNDLDAREMRLRTEEEPFRHLKEQLDYTAGYLNDREADLIQRETEFRARADAANEEIKEMVAAKKSELEAARSTRTAIDQE